MSAPAEIMADLDEWLARQPQWRRVVAHRMLGGEVFSEDSIQGLVDIVAREVAGEELDKLADTSFSALAGGPRDSVSITAIRDVKGVCALNPSRPLEFKSEGLSVIYGTNGSGKSSYVRILKSACGARHLEDVLHNVFSDPAPAPQCVIAFQQEGVEKMETWEPGTMIPALATADVFDAQCGETYFKDDKEASYEPKALTILSDLVRISDAVSGHFLREIQSRPSQLPAIPPEYRETPAGKWFSGINAMTSEDEVAGWERSNVERDEERIRLVNYLASSPDQQIAALVVQMQQRSKIAKLVQTLLDKFGDAAWAQLREKRAVVVEKRAAEQLANAIDLHGAEIDGIGSSVWRALWSAAKQYSKELAYPHADFPHTGDAALCLLCLQPLGAAAKARFSSFEEFVQSAAAKEARAAERNLAILLEQLPSFDGADAISSLGVAANLPLDLAGELLEIHKIFVERGRRFISDEACDVVDPTNAIANFQHMLNGLIAADEGEIQSLRTALDAEGLAKMRRLRVELDAVKWVAEQSPLVHNEVERAKVVRQFEVARSLCITTSITKTKATAAESLTTAEYVAAFNDELNRLGADHLNVELAEAPRAVKGTVLYRVKLKNTAFEADLADILSDGEKRVICLAAFLADGGMKAASSPFIFDDPITSLDCDYEEQVVTRLTQMAQTRQVIVFSHRISLVAGFIAKAEELDVPRHLVHVRRQEGTAGHPGMVMPEVVKPKSALSNEFLALLKTAEEVRASQGEGAYQIHAQGLCAQLRLLVERMIETDLLYDIVGRFRRDIKTLKLPELPLFTSDDCDFLDSMMTKYSFHEHSQPDEAPVARPAPDVIRADVNRLVAWSTNLSKIRAKAAEERKKK